MGLRGFNLYFREITKYSKNKMQKITQNRGHFYSLPKSILFEYFPAFLNYFLSNGSDTPHVFIFLKNPRNSLNFILTFSLLTLTLI